MQNIKLTSLQKDVLVFFGKNEFAKNFYWTGGTLLSYHYLHHRDSVDLDFFSEDLFVDNEYLIFINELKRKIGAEKITMALDKNRRIYSIQRDVQVLKVEQVFFPFTRIEPKNKLPEFSLNIDSLTDIMINKTLSTYQRNEPKDVFDLYCYFNKGNKVKKLPELINLVEKKFGVNIELPLLLAKINKLADNLDNLHPLLLVSEKNLVKKVKKIFQKIFDQFGEKTLK